MPGDNKCNPRQENVKLNIQGEHFSKVDNSDNSLEESSLKDINSKDYKEEILEEDSIESENSNEELSNENEELVQETDDANHIEENLNENDNLEEKVINSVSNGSFEDLPEMEVVYDEPKDKPIIEIKKGGIVSKYIESVLKVKNMENFNNDENINVNDDAFDDNIISKQVNENNTNDDIIEESINDDIQEQFEEGNASCDEVNNVTSLFDLESGDELIEEASSEKTNSKTIEIKSTSDLIREINQEEDDELDTSLEDLFNGRYGNIVPEPELNTSINSNNNISEEYVENNSNYLEKETEVKLEDDYTQEYSLNYDNQIDQDENISSKESVEEVQETEESNNYFERDDEVEIVEKLGEESQVEEVTQQIVEDEVIQEEKESLNELEDSLIIEEVVETKEIEAQEEIQPKLVEEKPTLKEEKVNTSNKENVEILIRNARSAYLTIEKIMKELYTYVFTTKEFRPTFDECMYDLKMYLANNAISSDRGYVVTQLFDIDMNRIDKRRGGKYIPYVYKLTEYVNKTTNKDIMSKVEFLINEIFKAFE